MENNKYGTIINLSTAAVDKPNSKRLHFFIAKSDLTVFSKALAFEFEHKGIHINPVSHLLTEMELLGDNPEKPNSKQQSGHPLSRLRYRRI